MLKAPTDIPTRLTRHIHDEASMHRRLFVTSVWNRNTDIDIWSAMIPTEFIQSDATILIQDMGQQRASCSELMYAREALRDSTVSSIKIDRRRSV